MPRKHVAHILAIEPSGRGLAYAAFDEERRLIDWGGFDPRINKNQQCLDLSRKLITGFWPKYFVVEDAAAISCRRAARIKELLKTIRILGEDMGCPVYPLARLSVRQWFCRNNAKSKQDIAEAVCQLYPELSPRLPRRRKPWESERYALTLFEAVALGVAFQSSMHP